MKLYNTSADVFFRDFVVYADTIYQTWCDSYNPYNLTLSYTSADVLSGAWDLQIKFQSLGLLGLPYNLMISYTSADVFSRTWVFMVYADTIYILW